MPPSSGSCHYQTGTQAQPTDLSQQNYLTESGQEQPPEPSPDNATPDKVSENLPEVVAESEAPIDQGINKE